MIAAALVAALLAPPAAAQSASTSPALSGPGIIASTATLPPSVRSGLSAYLAAPRVFGVRRKVPAAPGDLAEGLALDLDSLRSYRDADARFRAGGGRDADGSLDRNAALSARRRGGLLRGLALLQHAVERAASPASYDAEALRWRAVDRSLEGLQSRFPADSDFERVATEAPEHERKPAPVESGELEFKP